MAELNRQGVEVPGRGTDVSGLMHAWTLGIRDLRGPGSEAAADTVPGDSSGYAATGWTLRFDATAPSNGTTGYRHTYVNTSPGGRYQVRRWHLRVHRRRFRLAGR